MDGKTTVHRAIAAMIAEGTKGSLAVGVPGAPIAITVWAQGPTVALDVSRLSPLQKTRARNTFMALGAHPYHIDQMTAGGKLEHAFPDAAAAAGAVCTIFEKVAGKPVGSDVVVERHG